ncbi:MAG: arsenate reductase family protein [Erysipelotrichaceae bacterium]|nr:arsenate reductase family protein [Erysipelotrichaceae bacterium]MDD3924726.1 arsenate reductase family protein [Erysipelotrichaceae bacterium]MDD4642763.1 arsenate reductase family protein [Erysipelotrichaceae bacterium]
MLFICYPRCSTCKKAQRWLDDHGFDYTFKDIKLDNPQVEELNKWYKLSGLELKRFFNTSGDIYRSLNLKDKLTSMSEAEQLRLLATNGMLVKRPLLILDDKVLVGFKEKEWQDKLKV